MTEKKHQKSNPHIGTGTPQISLGRDLSIFQIGESQKRYGVHSNLGTNVLEAIWILSQDAYCDAQYAFCKKISAGWMSTLNHSDLEEKDLYCIAICILHAYCTSQGVDYIICHTNEFVQSRFLDGFLNCTVYINENGH